MMQKCLLVIVLIYSSVITDGFAVSKRSQIFLGHSRHRRQTDVQGCTLPNYPANGLWKLLNGNANPGESIQQSSVIKFECNTGFKLSTEHPYFVCDEKWSSAHFPECEQFCPPLYSSTTFDLKCTDKRGSEVKCSEATDGTYVEYACAHSYETPFGYKKTFICSGGKWSQKPVCHPICGKKVNEANTLIVGTKANTKIEYPWVTTLYQKANDNYKYVCGGSILSLTVVLTAAHCVTNDFGDILPKEDYLIGAGKLYSKYKAEQDTQAQYLEVSKIFVHNNYKGDSRRYLADIAVLIVKGEFTLNKVVQPICFNNMNTIYLHPGNKGVVSGWGRTEDRNISEVLRSLELPYKYEATCAEELPPLWANKFNIVDKICAGFFNKSTSVCDGDSGNSLAFVNPEDNRYYVHGIVSLGPLADDHCDFQQNSLYTKVAFYYEYVDRLLTAYAPIVRDCVMPAYPKNGKWTTEEEGLKPGDAVPSSTVLKLECNQGFVLSPPVTSINCGASYGMPTCQSVCPQLPFPTGTSVQCTNRQRQPIDCKDANEGSMLWYRCPKGYTVPQGTVGNRTCTRGSWGSPQPECLPAVDCGKIPESSRLRRAVEGAEGYPWNVNLYEKQNYSPLKEYMYICGGSLLSRSIVLTSAVCISGEKGQVLAKENYMVGVGEAYAKFSDSRNTNSQHSNLSQIVLHETFRGERRRYLGDIAILVLEKPFTLSPLIQPICFTGVNNIDFRPGHLGTALKYAVANAKQEVINIPYIDDRTCEDELPSTFADRYQLNDKLCAGFSNGTNLCRGDSGKGLYVRNAEDRRYYVYGIASVNPGGGEGKCHYITLYTKVPFYYDFVNDAISQYN